MNSIQFIEPSKFGVGSPNMEDCPMDDLSPEEKPVCRELKSFFEQIKEDAGLFTDYYRLFLDSNEGNQSLTLSKIKKLPRVGNMIVATSGFFGLNVAARRSSLHHLSYVLMVDCSLGVERFWIQFQGLIKENAASDRQTFIRELKRRLVTRANQFWPTGPYHQSVEDAMLAIRQMDLLIENKQSWLATDKRFNKIKQIILNDHFIFKRINLCDKEATSALANSMIDLQLKIDVIYLSNVREYAEREMNLGLFQEAFHELKKAMVRETILIDTEPRLGALSGCMKLKQRIHEDFLDHPLNVLFPPSIGRHPSKR